MSKETFKQFIRYCIAGVFNACIGLSVVYAIKDYTGILLANVFSSVVGVVTNFFTTKLFTFKSKGGNTTKQGSYFLGIYLTGFVCMISALKFLLWQKGIIESLSGLMRFLTPTFVADFLGNERFLSITGSEMVATYCGVVVFASINFTLNKFLTFKH
ncbi:MAG: GtrA family protein [Cytophagales bacterium]